MNVLDRLERKFGRHAIQHLTPIIIITYVTGYILELMGMSLAASPLTYLSFSPTMIARGQVWRLVTWILMPPSSLSIWTILMLFCIYQQGVMLERVWGDFKFDFYIFNGLILTLIAGFIAYAIRPAEMEYFSTSFSTYYISLSVFLGLALTFPEMEFRFMFLIPIKAKYLVVFYAAYLIYVLVASNSVVLGAMIIASGVNMALFFFLYRSGPRMSRSQRQTRNNYRRAMRGGPNSGEKVDRSTFGNSRAANEGANGGQHTAGQPSGGTDGQRMRGYSGKKRQPIHRCTVCGRTELDDPNLEFRFCSKCNGNYEYCMDHLYNHKHIQ